MIGFKKLAHKVTNLLLALFIISAQLFAPISAIVPRAHAAGQITFGAQFENQTFPDDPNTWTNGQLDNYSEGDFVNFRYQLNATQASGAGIMQIEFDKGTCGFFTNYFDIASVTPAIATVTEGSQTEGSQHFTQLLNVTFNTAGTTTVIFTLQLSNTAGECNGSNTGVRLGVPNDKNNTTVDENGDFDNVGAKTLPMSANTVLENPSLTITKTVESGDADPDEFYFTFSPAINGQTEVHIPEGQSSVTINEVNPDGEFTITEHGPNGYTFTGGTGTNCVDDDATIGTAGGVMTATVTAHASSPVNANCNFSNTQQTGSITVVKNTVGGDDTFNFTGNVGVTSLTTSNGTASQTVNNLTPGNYNIAETVPAGWDLTNTTCVSSIQDTESAGSLELDPNETITCTFTNTKRGHLIVQKTTNPAQDPTVFTINASGTGTITGGGAGSITDATDHNYEVTPGTYSVSETLPAGWSKDESACQNVVVAPGATVYCTITNTKLATLRIIKDALPNHSDNFAFITSALPGGGSFTLDDDSSATGEDATHSTLQTFSNLTPGVAYGVTESALAGWQLTNLTCDTGSWNVVGSQVTVTPTPGQTITCTFENTKLRSISGTKYESNATGGLGSVLSGWTVFIDQDNDGILDGNELSDVTDVNGNYSFDNLLPGNYVLKEVLKAGWTQIFAPNPVDLTYDADSTGNDFGNFENGSVSGYKWNDLDGDGGSVAEDGEPKLAGWTIKLFRSSDNTEGNYVEIGSTVTDANGNYSFTNLSPLPSRFYAVCEVQQTGWVQTAPQNNACRYFEMNVSGESNTGRNFGNQGRGTITVNKNVDTDGDGDVDITGATDWTWDIAGGAQNTATGSSQNVAAGTYTISEDQQTNYHVVSVVCDTQVNTVSESAQVVVAPGANVTCTFTNARDTGTIEVIKSINPTDDDGTFDLRISGVTKKEDARHGDTTGTVQVVTGNYDVSELAGNESTSLDDYDTTLTCTRNGQTFLDAVATTDSDDFSISANDAVVCTFTNTAHGEIIVIKDAVSLNDDDLEQDFCFTIDEADLLLTLEDESLYDEYIEGCEGFLLDDDNDETLSNTETTEVSTGWYAITEEETEGWDLADIDCDNDEIVLFDSFPGYSYENYSRDIFVAPGQTVTCTFVNEKRAEVIVTKYNDYDRDGNNDDNEPVLPDWEFTLDDEYCNLEFNLLTIGDGFDLCNFFCSITGGVGIPGSVDCGYFQKQETGEDGTATFTDVKPGVDHFLSETEQEGWEWSDTDCSYQSRESYGTTNGQYNRYELEASPGETVNCFIGNYRDAYMLIEKTNNRPDPTVVGDVVTYTLTVTVPEDSNPVYDATVTDLPPEGFEYIPGSETTTKPGAFLEHPYASPGIWSLGDIFPGEVVVLTYRARIANSVSPGTYPDLAFASGCNDPESIEENGCEVNVYANVTVVDEQGTPFVGTKVTIKAPQVLAANVTVLVNTGAADIWRNLAVGTLLMGVALATLYRREQKGGRA